MSSPDQYDSYQSYNPEPETKDFSNDPNRRLKLVYSLVQNIDPAFEAQKAFREKAANAYAKFVIKALGLNNLKLPLGG